jgi:integrase/recombinase XerD
MAIITRRRKDGSIRFVIDYWPDGRYGKRKRLTLPASVQSEKEAKVFEEALKTAARDPEMITTFTATETVNDVFPSYLEWYEMHRQSTTYEDLLEIYKNHLKGIFGKLRLDEINIVHISLYKKTRKAEVIIKHLGQKKGSTLVSNRTINKELSYFSGFLKWCRVERNMPLKKITFDRLPYKRPIPMVLSFDEVIKMIEASDPFYRALFFTLYGAGLRSAEGRNLKLEDVDFENRTIRVRQKGGSQKIVPVPQLLLDLISAIKPAHQEDYVFVNRRTRRPVNDIRRPIERARVKAGIIKKVTPHLFRHSIATHLLGKSVNLRTIQKFLGHAQVLTTEFYTHVDMGHMRTASDAMFSGLPEKIRDHEKIEKKTKS